MKYLDTLGVVLTYLGAGGMTQGVGNEPERGVPNKGNHRMDSSCCFGGLSNSFPAENQQAKATFCVVDVAFRLGLTGG